MKSLCQFESDDLGTSCKRCGCWWRLGEFIECPPFITRCEPDAERLPHLAEQSANDLAHKEYMDRLMGKDRPQEQ